MTVRNLLSTVPDTWLICSKIGSCLLYQLEFSRKTEPIDFFLHVCEHTRDLRNQESVQVIVEEHL